MIQGAALCVFALSVLSCDLPPEADYGKGTLSLQMPGRASPAPDKSGSSSRSLVSKDNLSSLMYRITLTGAENTIVLVAEENQTLMLALEPGKWIIEVLAYDTANVLAGSGTVEIVVTAGEELAAKIPMQMDPDYEVAYAASGSIYIHNEAELRRLAEPWGIPYITDSAVEFILENDIALTQPWTPIGAEDSIFKASFDGRGHTITINGFVNTPTQYLGLFGRTNGGHIKNLALICNLGPSSIPIISDDIQYLGGLVGSADSTIIEGITVLGNIHFSNTGPGSIYLGGIAGENMGAIKQSSFTGVIKGTITGASNSATVGGVAGTSGTGSITLCYVSGTMEVISGGSAIAGGIAGSGSIIDSCYAWVKVNVKGPGQGGYAGGIAGYGDEIRYCYALGDVVAEGLSSAAGGIAGTSSNGVVEGCAAFNTRVSSLSTPGSTHGIVGREDTPGLYVNNYTVSELHLESMILNGNTTRSRSDFTGAANESAYTALLNWGIGFGLDWKWIPGYDYPALSWQTQAAPEP
ncbi:GLUG domain protein [Treponema primitia ZAS-2]|uniref:GLUG domain protein n=1 Tax=Treponema primitia (strain ATCC BAA-887 / DSM 12427 / ZAS-2) TaxID=545694 RepID=F5YKR5_TREPZ|nr:GLUG domain protein [Treponema primitia ZAS-2]